MVKFLSQFLLAGMLFITGIAQAHIYQIEKWSNGSQDIYCLNDYHRSSEPHNQICNQQQIDIVSMAKKYNAFVIVEDALFYSLKEMTSNPRQFDPNQNYSAKISTDQFNLAHIPNDQAPIFGLTSHCHHAQIPVDNIEFRQVKIASLCDGFIPCEAAFDYTINVREQIMHYNDDSLLNNYYKEKVVEYSEAIKPCVNFFNQLCDQNGSLKEALPLVPYNKQLDAVQLPHVNLTHMDEREKKEHIITHYDTTLIDLRIIHSIHTHKKHPALFICAGAGHIERIEPALKIMGFELLDRYHETHDTDREPRALDIAHYFKSEEPKTGVLSWLNSLLSFF